jgi:hypothetical protein
MDTAEYVVSGRLEADIDQLLRGQVLAARDVAAPPDSFLAELPEDARRAIAKLTEMMQNGTFPDLYDLTPEWGRDTSSFPNVDREAFALGNDGSGNYWLLCADGTVRSWCHDEGGIMEDHNSFASLDEALACWVRYTAVREEHITLDDLRPVFEAKSRDQENGWAFFLETLEDL